MQDSPFNQMKVLGKLWPKKDITSPVPSGVLVTPPLFVALSPFAETHDLVESVDATRTALLWAILLKNRIKTQVTQHYYLAARRVYDVFAPLGIQQIYGTTIVTFNTFRLLLNEDLQQLIL
ncbi:14002_t:CDS:2 [Dentiscutata erythropus]|uniref:14002_t:CDS:1 n=1 Tax=Dentiscutata erythropus TaxID=1348616 RepID=A0A9N9I390_9GLOM|nr:14002_t:CDS:2 [Dentiscutata erythropus]